MAKVRITGLNLPWLGVTWEYQDTDADIVQRVITFLEDRRVLYEPLNAQTFFYVGQSVVEIRRTLGDELNEGPTPDLKAYLERVRSLLRKFNSALDKLQADDQSGRLAATGLDLREQQVLALGEMRGRVNPLIAALADKYEIEVEKDLAEELLSSIDSNS